MIRIDGKEYRPQHFPDGTFRLNCGPAGEAVEMEWRFEHNEELLVLIFLVQHMREVLDVNRITLRLPYLPNARMDRVRNTDEVFTLKHFCRLINTLEFERVIVRDVHSNVALALLDRAEAEDLRPRLQALSEQLLVHEQDLLFFPDEGASKRYSGFFQRPYLFGVKTRDWSTGTIQGLDVIGAVPSGGFNVLIVDDICSYGGTFHHSAKKLKALGADKIWLYVTHCENNVLNGELLQSGLIDRIYTTESIFTAASPLVEMI